MFSLFGCSKGSSAAAGELNFTVESLEKRDEFTKLSSLKGNVVLVDFWATWCGPCLESMPIIQKIHEDYGPKGLKIMAVTDEARQTVNNFKKDKPYKYPVYLDSDGSANREMGVDALPTAFVISKTGKLLFKGNPLDRDALISAIERGLAE